jgi:two-component system sensor histidine kinase MprB
MTHYTIYIVILWGRKTSTTARFVQRIEPFTARGAPSRLARAIHNLLDNAAKWSPSGGEVEVRLQGGALSVRDHGPGIAPEDLPFNDT